MIFSHYKINSCDISVNYKYKFNIILVAKQIYEYKSRINEGESICKQNRYIQ